MSMHISNMEKKFDFRAAMAAGWKEAEENYRNKGIDPNEVLSRVSKVIRKMRGVPASSALPKGYI